MEARRLRKKSHFRSTSSKNTSSIYEMCDEFNEFTSGSYYSSGSFTDCKQSSCGRKDSDLFEKADPRKLPVARFDYSKIKQRTESIGSYYRPPRNALAMRSIELANIEEKDEFDGLANCERYTGSTRASGVSQVSQSDVCCCILF